MHDNRGETGVGKWTVVIRDTKENEHNGTFTDWHLKLWGESKDASKAKKLPLPTEDDDANHDEIQSIITAPAATATVTHMPELSHTLLGNPTDHPHRPTKPTDGSEAQSSGTTDAEKQTSTAASSWISKFPTFGASKTAQMWIAGAFGLIIAFCIGLGIFFWVARRRRMRNNARNEYDFELLDEEEADGLNSGEKGGNRGKRTRGGELYDAFAEGSEDEEEFDTYKDRSTERLASGSGSGSPSGDLDRDEEQHVIGEESDDEGDHRAESKPLSGERS